jgi:molybdopterin-binding protein
LSDVPPICVAISALVVPRESRKNRRFQRTSSMKLSARNQLKGKIVAVVKGQTTAHVRIDLGNGMVITSSITNEAVDDLQLAVGEEAVAIIKASDVMIAK